MIEIQNVTKKFGDYTAVKDVNITVDDTSIYGLIGYNGAGKTTLLKVCAGIYEAQEGRVLIDGENVFNNNTNRSKLFFVPDDMNFLPNSSMQTMAKFYSGYYPDFNMDMYKELAEKFELNRYSKINSFSKGMKRQAQITFALASMPKYLLLDECFDGLDPQKRHICRKIFLEYMSEYNCSMIMSSHNLSELSNMADHIGFINGNHLFLNEDTNDLLAYYKKYNVVCNYELSEDMFDFANARIIKIKGKQAVVYCYSKDDLTEKFNTLNPVVFDEYAMTLDEIFLAEIGEAE